MLAGSTAMVSEMEMMPFQVSDINDFTGLAFPPKMPICEAIPPT